MLGINTATLFYPPHAQIFLLRPTSEQFTLPLERYKLFHRPLFLWRLYIIWRRTCPLST